MKMEQNKVTLLLGMMELYRRIINDRLKSNVVFGRYPLSNPDTERTSISLRQGCYSGK